MYPMIYENGQRVAILNNITSDKLVRRINNKFLFEFTCFEEEYKTEFIKKDNEIRLGDKFFDINYIEVTHDTTDRVKYRVKCEHVSYQLIKDSVDTFVKVDTPTNILADILVGTDFNVGIVDFSGIITFSVTSTSTKLQMVIALVTQLGGEVDFRDYNIDLLDTIGKDEGYQIRLKKNLKGIKKTIDFRGTNEVAYNVDLVNIFKSDEFKGSGLENLESVNIGDVVTVIDETLGINIVQSVIELSKDVLDDRNFKVVLSNTLDVINNDIYNKNQNAVKKSEKLYGVSINADVGVEIERTDQFAKATFNADEFSMQVGDGAGNYTNAVFFDIIEKLYKFIGILEVENSGITVKIDPGGTNVFEIKDGSTELFTVDNTGKSTYKADIETDDDIIVGNVLQVGKTLSTLNAIIFGPGGPTSPVISSDSSGKVTINGKNGIALDPSGDLEINGSIKTFGSSVVSFDSFTTAGGKTVTVRNGLITNIV